MATLKELYVPLEPQNQERTDSPNWSALARESRPPHWFSTAICSAVHRPHTSPMPSPSACAASPEIGPPPPLWDAAMVSRGLLRRKTARVFASVLSCVEAGENREENQTAAVACEASFFLSFLRKKWRRRK